MLIGPTKPFKSEHTPTRLPAELLPELVRTKRVLLCLDYDGTISEIVRDPAAARPVAGVPETLAELALRRDRIALAIVSGREVAKLREMLSVPSGIALSGLHGLELVDFDGRDQQVRIAGPLAEYLVVDHNLVFCLLQFHHLAEFVGLASLALANDFG